MVTSTQIYLAETPAGIPEPHHFARRDVELATPDEGQLLVETLYLSLDPYMRGQIAGRHISGAVKPGDLMRGEAVSRVLTSTDKRFQPGDLIAAHSGWQSHAVVQVEEARPLGYEGLSPSLALGVLGMPGLTAYAGVLKLAEPAAGDIYLVSAASGPVGSLSGQIARIMGCRTIGIAGGPDKCKWLTDEARFDAALDYRQTDIRQALETHAPEGVDIYFDNVGGDLLLAAMERLRLGARVVLCGLMAQYNSDTPPPGPNPAFIIKARATVRGLVVYDHEALRPQFVHDVAGWIRDGLIAIKEDVTEGLENAPHAFSRLMRGANFGKTIVKV